MVRYDLFKWYKYGGKLLSFEENRHNKEYILELHPGNCFGVRLLRGKYTVVHKTTPDILFTLKKIEVDRLIEHSKGWTGKVRKITVNAGKGGLDKEKKKPKDPALRVLEIDSSNLLNCTYDIKHKTLYVEFRNGAVWAYEKVTPKEVDALEAAPSQGRYFIYMIRGPKPQYRVDAMPQSATNPPPKFGVLNDEDEPDTFPLETEEPHVTQVTMDHSGKMPKVTIVKPQEPDVAKMPPVPKVDTSHKAVINEGAKTVPLKLGPRMKSNWMGSEEGSWEDKGDVKPQDHPYAILQRGKIQNERELVILMRSAHYASFDEEDPRSHKALVEKLEKIAKEYPLSENGKKAVQLIGRPGFEAVFETL